MIKKRQIICDGVITLGNNKIPCYVLEDGTRVLSSRSMQQALKMVDDDNKHTGDRVARYLSQKSLEPFIYRDKSPAHYDPLICYRGNQQINGYEGTRLADICEAFLEARNNIDLAPRQKIIADECEILMRGFARVGIIALIDEATGYQYDREKFELQKILNAYVSEEASKWQLTFSLDFYKEIFRLWGVPFTPENIRRKPRFIAVLTVKYIYKNLPNGVYDKLKEVTPKDEKGNYKVRLHQYLTSDIGKEDQKKILHEVTAFASISDKKEEFNLLVEKKYSNEPIQLQIEFDEPVEQLSLFNENLKKTLEYSKT